MGVVIEDGDSDSWVLMVCDVRGRRLVGGV